MASFARQGPYMHQLLNSSDLGYYNGNAKRSG